MRTGSNHLEESLNLAPGVSCHGELFNPGFVGGPNKGSAFGFDRAARNADPMGLIEAMVAGTEGLPGFRFFHDHIETPLKHLLPDPRWAKVILRRDPLDSYVSLKIARLTGQWRITAQAHRKSAKVVFDAEEYAAHVAATAGFQSRLRRELQITGQAPFDIDYEQILDVATVNGIFAFLGVSDRLGAVSGRLQRQNPGHVRDKVENPEEMEDTLRELGHQHRAEAGITPTNAIPELRVAERTLFLALPGVPVDRVPGMKDAEVVSQDLLRPWLNRTKGHSIVAGVSHPIARAWRLCGDVDLMSYLGSRRMAGQADLLQGAAAEVLPTRIERIDDGDVGDMEGHYSAELEAEARRHYNRDYRMFGYGKWRR